MSNLKAHLKNTTTDSETIVDQIECTLGMYCAVCIEKIGLIYLGKIFFDFFVFDFNYHLVILILL